MHVLFLNATRHLQGVIILNFTWSLCCDFLLFFQLTSKHQLAFVFFRKQTHSCTHLHIHTHSFSLQPRQKCNDQLVLKCSPLGFPLCSLHFNYALYTCYADLFSTLWLYYCTRRKLTSTVVKQYKIQQCDMCYDEVTKYHETFNHSWTTELSFSLILHPGYNMLFHATIFF